jgi:hypothetical protein
MIKGRVEGLPIIYDSQKTEKSVVDLRDDKKQVEGQLSGHNSKVGFATNISSSLYCMLEEFPRGSKEQDVILKRLKIGRVIQGEIIDGVKGLKVPPFRNHWTKYTKITSDMSPEEIEKWKFNNKILCEKRPSFFRFLYPHYMTRYNKELKKYNIYSHLTYGVSFDDLCKNKNRTEEQSRLLDYYKHMSFFIENNSTVNKISRYMRTNLGLIDKYSTKLSQGFDYSVLINKNNVLNPYNIAKMKTYLQEYKAFKKGMRHDLKSSHVNLDAFISYLQKECAVNISSNESELADYAVEVTYGGEISMAEFAWRVFGSGILENIMVNSSGTITIPVEDPAGDIEYLWNKYSLKEFSLEKIYEE